MIVSVYKGAVSLRARIHFFYGPHVHFLENQFIILDIQTDKKYTHIT